MQVIKERSAFSVQRAVLFALWQREVRSRFSRSRVGFVWSLFEPLAHLIGPVLVFGFVLQRTVPGYDYPVYALHGLMPFLMFKTTAMQTMDRAGADRNLLMFRQIHPIDLMLTRAFALMTVEGMLFFGIFIGLDAWGFSPWPFDPLQEMAIWVLAMTMGLGVGMVLAAICAYMPDARLIIRLCFIPLYFASGVMFPVTRFPAEWIKWMVALNPVLHLVELSRSYAFRDFHIDYGITHAFPLWTTLIAAFLGLSLYRIGKVNRVLA